MLLPAFPPTSLTARYQWGIFRCSLPLLKKCKQQNAYTTKKTLTNKAYLDCKSAQNTPLFLPMVFSLEFTVKQFPCAVQSTEIYRIYCSGKKKTFQTYVQMQQRTVSRVRTMLTSSCNANKNRSSVESPCSRLDKNCNVQARTEQIGLLNIDLKWTMLFNNQISHLASSKSATLS